MVSKKCPTLFLSFRRLIALRIRMALPAGPNLKERTVRLKEFEVRLSPARIELLLRCSKASKLLRL